MSPDRPRSGDMNPAAIAAEAAAKRPPKPSRGEARRSARVAAVQALYQMDLAQTDVSDVIAQFQEFRFDSGDEGMPEAADAAFFGEIVRGVVRLQREIDPVVDKQLAEGWSLVRIDSTLRAVLRAALYELTDRKDIPARVVIAEYVDVAKAFFDDEEPKVVNGVLDKVAKRLRADEF